MNTKLSTGMRPKITLLMVLCGVTSAASMAAVSVATAGEQLPSMAFKFDPHSLDTDSGARELYGRLQQAAERACPGLTTGSRLPSAATVHCREELVSRAVSQINNPRLAALHDNHAKSG